MVEAENNETLAVPKGSLLVAPSHLQMEITSWLKIIVLAGTICGAIIGMGFHIGGQIASDEARITALELDQAQTRTVMQNLSTGLTQLHLDMELLEQRLHDVDGKYPAPPPAYTTQSGNPKTRSAEKHLDVSRATPQLSGNLTWHE